ncbi:cGMP-specific 3',5'-cyclic phosphodiesterase-like [Anthonomus grandis grandis]|uniref:cGMP-specific 3',5'-cyclic phosphodiesterase-like n=1 Tax=Anthonomus grandis grandis TaxID=2921223 RepID=UPI00216694CE|nr:cGMP-specific 3',5'-cyclic phosphodiesterase-like [Anthonomus grandis grandis]
MVPPPPLTDGCYKPTDLAAVGTWLESNPEIFGKWLRENASDGLRQRALEAVTTSKVTTISSTNETHQTRATSYDSTPNNQIEIWYPPVGGGSSSSSSSAAAAVSDCNLQNVRPRAAAGFRHTVEEESDLFMELIRDIANELNIDVLCHKILRNVSLLTNADRGSLFLAKGSCEGRYLVSKFFDVRNDTSFDEAVRLARSEEIRIPFGVGIAGTVAQNKVMINIKDAYKDPRFNNEIDLRTGYKTDLILCMPICNYEGDVIGVAQIINKTDDSPEFSKQDVELFQRYLTFCGIGIQNAQLFEVSVLEYKRNQILLNLARSIFEEQNNLECLVTKIMREAQDLLKCERCAVYLLDLDCCEANHLQRIVERPGKAIQRHAPLNRMINGTITGQDMIDNFFKKPSPFTTIFELREGGTKTLVSRPSSFDLAGSTLAQIAGYAASTGQILNIGDVGAWLCEKHGEGDAETAMTILCMPIINGQRTLIGVAQLINKENGAPFTDCDVSLFEAFAIFCGLGIHNTQMYENACKLMAKQKVALECLSYHATASNDATTRLLKEEIPSAERFNLYSFTFIDFDLSDDETCKATIRMFLECNLVQQFHIPYEVLCRWVLSVKKNYRPVKYHNWRHALNVAQTMFAMFKTGKMERFMSDLEMLGLLVACLCHDLDHRGTNNAFQTKTESPLAILYSTSTMEHHHFDQCVMILNTDSNNIFQALSPDDYRRVMKLVETAILSTDLAMYFKKRNKFLELIDNGEFDWQSDDKKDLLSGMMMTACDVSAIAKPWEVQHRIAKLVADEFFDQGDLEKMQLKEQPIAMMDRERKDELPQMQVGFIDVICLPLYKVLSETFPWMKPLYQGTAENRQHWQDLAEKVEMGLTWIDHDTIDKPVEAFKESEETKDIELTVQTLHTVAASTPPVEIKKRHKKICCML